MIRESDHGRGACPLQPHWRKACGDPSDIAATSRPPPGVSRTVKKRAVTAGLDAAPLVVSDDPDRLQYYHVKDDDIGATSGTIRQIPSAKMRVLAVSVRRDAVSMESGVAQPYLSGQMRCSRRARSPRSAALQVAPPWRGCRPRRDYSGIKSRQSTRATSNDDAGAPEDHDPDGQGGSRADPVNVARRRASDITGSDPCCVTGVCESSSR